MFKTLRRRLRVRLGPDGKRILALHDNLQGLIFVEESAWLYHAARGRRCIVEIGSFRGKSCVMLASGSGEVEGAVTAIDPHLNLGSDDKTTYGKADADAFTAAVERHGVAGRVTKWTMTSAEALDKWDGSEIDLLWIDGDHSYAGIKFDLANWKKFVRIGGILAAHDYTHKEEIRQAWEEEVTQDPSWGPIHQVRSIAAVVRVK